jgi:hypothetical protein
MPDAVSLRQALLSSVCAGAISAVTNKFQVEKYQTISDRVFAIKAWRLITRM